MYKKLNLIFLSICMICGLSACTTSATSETLAVKTSELTLEAGTEITINDFLADSVSVGDRSKVIMSVNGSLDEPGDVVVTLELDSESKDVVVHVQDTTQPVFEDFPEKLELNVMSQADAKGYDLTKNFKVSDNTECVISILGEYVLTKVGSYEVTVKAVDKGENAVSKTCKVVVNKLENSDSEKEEAVVSSNNQDSFVSNNQESVSDNTKSVKVIPTTKEVVKTSTVSTVKKACEDYELREATSAEKAEMSKKAAQVESQKIREVYGSADAYEKVKKEMKQRIQVNPMIFNLESSLADAYPYLKRIDSDCTMYSEKMAQGAWGTLYSYDNSYSQTIIGSDDLKEIQNYLEQEKERYRNTWVSEQDKKLKAFGEEYSKNYTVYCEKEGLRAGGYRVVSDEVGGRLFAVDKNGKKIGECLLPDSLVDKYSALYPIAAYNDSEDKLYS